MPVGIVPGGSGNALNCSLLRQLHQPLDGINNLGATWAGTNVAVGAAEDKSLPLDLLEVELANDAGQKHISFLGVTIGLIADCDIGNKAESLQLNRTQFPSLRIFVSKKVGNRKNKDHVYYFSFKSCILSGLSFLIPNFFNNKNSQGRKLSAV